jgi:hypothetical protein
MPAKVCLGGVTMTGAGGFPSNIGIGTFRATILGKIGFLNF